MQLDETVDRDSVARSERQPELREHLFLVLECQTPRAGGARYALSGIDQVVFGRGASRAVSREVDGKTSRLAVRVPDPLMSAAHARLTRSKAGWVLEDLGSRNGTFVDGQKLERAELDAESLVELGGSFFTVRTHSTPHDTAVDVESNALAGRARGFATLVPEYARKLQALAQIAFTELPVLLLGESGTGKEVLAGGVHALSGRRGELVAVNCGAIPGTLVEGQLFGHVKGAYSGALRDEIGFVRASDKGTLFLDEIGDLAATSQAALLRVLQEREVTPVGSTRTTKVDLRVVSATLRKVDALSTAGALRSDLYARLAGYTHHLLPLRERKEDLGMLIGDLLEKIAPGRDLKLTPSLARALFMHEWPLNVRELQYALSAAAAFATDGSLDLRHAPEALRAGPSRTSSSPPRVLGEADERLRAQLAECLASSRGNVSEVARALGKTRMQIHRWMRRFGLDPEAYRR